MLLALDTSTRAVGLALFNGSQVLYESVWSSRDFHTVELAPAIIEALEKSKRLAEESFGPLAGGLALPGLL